MSKPSRHKKASPSHSGFRIFKYGAGRTPLILRPRFAGALEAARAQQCPLIVPIGSLEDSGRRKTREFDGSVPERQRLPLIQLRHPTPTPPPTPAEPISPSPNLPNPRRLPASKRSQALECERVAAYNGEESPTPLLRTCCDSGPPHPTRTYSIEWNLSYCFHDKSDCAESEHKQRTCCRPNNLGRNGEINQRLTQLDSTLPECLSHENHHETFLPSSLEMASKFGATYFVANRGLEDQNIAPSRSSHPTDAQPIKLNNLLPRLLTAQPRRGHHRSRAESRKANKTK